MRTAGSCRGAFPAVLAPAARGGSPLRRVTRRPYDTSLRSIHQLPVTDFNLQFTLECGQAFRWQRDDVGLPWPGDPAGQGYTGVIGKAVWKVSQKGDLLFVETNPPASEGEIIRYFSLEKDLSRTVFPLRQDPVLASALKEFWGLRILRQDPWECLGSYLFSSFNNVKRIASLVENLSRHFGTPVGLNGLVRHTFPTADRIASLAPSDLRPIRPGFRDKYLLETARAVSEGKFDLEKLRRMETAEAKRALLTLPGVGEKVADCVLLFAYGREESFPIDVWIERALRKFYFRGRRRTLRKMQRFARRRFGPSAGYAQEYLYAYVRRHL